MKIVSLLPSATEIVFALGLGSQLEAVTFECDHPAAAEGLPQITGSALPSGSDVTPAEIDRAVADMVAGGEPIYTLDDELLRRIDPDLILTQDLCRVCAVPSGVVDDALAQLGCSSEVLSLDPHRLDEVIGSVGLVGRATGAEAAAAALEGSLRDRLRAVREAVAGRPRPRVLVLEWADPPFDAGHWVPDMVDTAGADAVRARPGERSQRLAWDEVGVGGFDDVVFMPCGFDLAGALAQAGPLLERPELADAGVIVVDADAAFSRPGPRLVDGVEALADVLHGTSTAGPDAPELARRVR